MQQVRILLRRTAWAGQTVYWKMNMKNRQLYVVNKNGMIASGIVKLEGDYGTAFFLIRKKSAFVNPMGSHLL